jgi:hypothetical protein
MGQPIEITGTTVVGDVAMFATDRGITGQDGVSCDDGAAASASGGFPGELAARLLEGDGAVDHVYVASNQVVARRRGGWDDEALAAAGAAITEFFVFYTTEPA